MDPASTTVNIFGQEYTIRGGEDPRYVEEIAQYVDARMREVSRDASQVSSVRVAILAALNITDELFQARQNDTGEVYEARARQLLKSLEATVGGQNPDATASARTGGETLPDA